MARVCIENVRKSYGSVVALHDISLDIPSGSFFTLLGPSGCGKTTLLRTIAGFHRQDSGSILVDEKEVGDIPVHRRDIGMVFQDYAIFPHLSVSKNIAFGLRQRKISKKDIDTRVAEILQVVQLTHLADRMPHELSGGQQQRVGLARSLVTNPQVLLMDEPLSNLDAQLRIDLRRELRTIQQALGITTIYVTHDQEEALEMSDYVCVMHKGVIQQSDTPWDIYHLPANRFVASFVGSNNFLPLGLHADKPAICGVPIDAPASLEGALSVDEVVASIRPEHINIQLISDAPANQDSHINIPVTLKYQSFAGRELRLTTETADGVAIQVITDPRPEYLQLPVNASIRLSVRRNTIGFFHSDDAGQRLSL